MVSFTELYRTSKGQSRAITEENRDGAKGGGGKAEGGILGTSRKSSAAKRGFKAGETYTIAEINGRGYIRHIWITVPDRTEKYYFVTRNIVLRMYWDGESEPSVEAPLGDFFCNGFGERCNVNSIPIVVNPSGGMNCYFPMPFRKSARITVTNEHPEDVRSLFYQVDFELNEDVPDDATYFHAQFRRENPTVLRKDYVILDGVSGRGKFVGLYMGLSALSRYWWGEGEVKMYIDGDAEWPTICGTGMEDYFGGAWGFRRMGREGIQDYETYSTPFLGYPYYSSKDSSFPDDWPPDCPPMHGLYRWHLLDPIIFNQDLKITIQQIGVSKEGLFERSDDVCSVAYWYQSEPHSAFPTLPATAARRPR
jgi:hypothetical protein